MYAWVWYLISNVFIPLLLICVGKCWLSLWCTSLIDFYLGESEKDFAFQLILNDFCLLVDEPKDVGRKHRNQVVVVSQYFFIVFSGIILLILLKCSSDVVLNYLFVMLNEVGHELFYFRFYVSHVGAINSCSWQHGFVVINPSKEGY